MLIGFGAVRFISHSEVREDAHHAQQALVLVVHGLAQQLVPVGNGAAIAPKAGVHLEMDPCGPFLLAGCRDDGVEFPTGDSDVDSGGNRCLEVALVGVQPGKQRGVDARGPQGECLGNVRHPEPRRPGVEGCPRNLDGSVTIRVCLHDGHDRGRRGDGNELPHVMAYSFEIDHRGPLQHRRFGY